MFPICSILGKKGYRVAVASLFSSPKGKIFWRGLTEKPWLNTFVLIFWVIFRKVKIIEYQSGGKGKILFCISPLQFLRARVGIVFHGLIDSTRAEKYIRQMDYACCVSPYQKERFPVLKGTVCCPNALEKIQFSWQFSFQRKALLVSRLDRDKLPSIRAFVKFCVKNKIPFEVAGEGSRKKFLKKYCSKVCERKNISIPIFLGSIKTESFLENNGKKYLFLGGLGQVALEGLGKGYPVLIPSMAGICFFINQKNIDSAWKCNFSPHQKTKCAELCKEVDSANEDYKKILKGDVSFLPKQLSSYFLFSFVFEKYRHAVLGYKEEKLHSQT